MRTLLQKTSDGMFFKGPDEWTPDPAAAFNFKSIDRAIGFIRKWNLSGMELAFAFAGQASVRRVPVDRLALDYLKD